MIFSASSPASSFCQQQAVSPSRTTSGMPPMAGGDDGQPRGGGLQKDQAQALLDLGRPHEDVPQEIGAGHLGRRDEAGEHHPAPGPGQICRRNSSETGSPAWCGPGRIRCPPPGPARPGAGSARPAPWPPAGYAPLCSPGVCRRTGRWVHPSRPYGSRTCSPGRHPPTGRRRPPASTPL